MEFKGSKSLFWENNEGYRDGEREKMIFYITSNPGKIEVAKKYLNDFGVQIEGRDADFIEGQSENIEEIAKSKAEQAFKDIQKPLFVSDSGWSIPALNGFPGPFMKYVNHWLSPEDFLKLMEGKENRDVILEEVVVYKDQNQERVFTHKLTGKILNEIRGEGLASECVMSFLSNGKSIAECMKEGVKSIDSSTLWEEFGEWLKENNLNK